MTNIIVSAILTCTTPWINISGSTIKFKNIKTVVIAKANIGDVYIFKFNIKFNQSVKYKIVDSDWVKANCK
ncbi:MAG: hypothetical protein DRR06_20015 [Gammaproteobacteria bacterium]|nr:MAG: hypothetical protein DRR06_20015 [Gammaproteobacteria bacterium]